MIHYQWEPRLSKPLVEAEILSGKDWAPIARGDNQNPLGMVVASYTKIMKA